MKKRITYILFLPVVLLFLTTSCFEDKGNYDYGELQDATVNIPGVTDQKNEISCDWHADLVLKPEIKFNAGASAADFNFEWSLYLQNMVKDEEGDYPGKKIVGDKSELTYRLVDVPDKYYMVLKVTNKTTGVCTDYRFKLNINSMKGWLVYDENAAGEGDLQIIRDREIVPGLSAGQNGVVRDYFSFSNNGEKLRGGKWLARRTMRSYDHLFVFTGDGVVKMGAGAYDVITKEYSSLFLSAPKVFAPQAHYYPSPLYGAVEVILNNNEVHVIKWNTMGQVDKFNAPLNVFGTAIKVNPFIAPIPVVSGNTNRAVLYNDIDNAAGKFVVVNQGGTQVNPATPAGLFNTAKINVDASTNLRLAWLGQGRDGLTCALFRDLLANNKPWLYVADFRTATPLTVNKIDLSGLPDISNAERFAFGTRGDVLFYAAGSKVYSYVFNGAATEILDVAGDAIVSMKLYTHSDNEDFSGRVLFVATYNAGMHTGKIYKIEFNELNGQKEGDVEIFDNFGRIVDMISKE